MSYAHLYPTISIAGRTIGKGHPVYMIAEMSANHNGDFSRAKALVHAAADAGVDAIKLQTYTADTITLKHDSAPFRLDSGTVWDGRTLHELYSDAFTPWEWQPELKSLAESLGLACFSSPFDGTAVSFLEKLDVPAYKIASFELVDLPLIRTVAKTGKPMIMSTGMATLGEIDEAVQAARVAGNTELALLKTNSAYPAPPSEMNLRTLPHLGRSFSVPAGLSDHTLGTEVALAAVALGATLVEKHLCLRRSDGGPDSDFSLEPEEFGQLVTQVRSVEAALGSVVYEPTEKQRASLPYRRSLFVVKNIKKGEAFTTENIRSIRPGDGLHTRHLSRVLASHASEDIARGTPLSFKLIVSS